MYNIFKLSGENVHVKYRPSLFHSAEEKNIRTLSLGIQNNEAIIKLKFTTFVGIVANDLYF